MHATAADRISHALNLDQVMDRLAAAIADEDGNGTAYRACKVDVRARYDQELEDILDAAPAGPHPRPLRAVA